MVVQFRDRPNQVRQYIEASIYTCRKGIKYTCRQKMLWTWYRNNHLADLLYRRSTVIRAKEAVYKCYSLRTTSSKRLCLLNWAARYSDKFEGLSPHTFVESDCCMVSLISPEYQLIYIAHWQSQLEESRIRRQLNVSENLIMLVKDEGELKIMTILLLAPIRFCES